MSAIAGPLAISAWSVVSPFGLGNAAFAEGLESTAGPGTTVPGFEVRELLGAKGTRAMNRITGLAVVATRGLLAEFGEETPGERTGVVLGTTMGSAESMMGLTRASLTGDRPDHIEPALVPGAVMNCAAGQVAIWHRITGPNATIAAGRNSGVLALNYACRLLVAGRADRVLCGAVEEHSAARTALQGAAYGQRADEIGEGAVMLAVEPEEAILERGARPLASLVAVESRTGADPESALRAAVGLLLERTGLRAADVRAPGLRDTALTGECAPGTDVRARIGDTGSAAGLFELAGMLASARAGYGLITGSEEDGTASALLLRMHEPALAGAR